MSVQVKRNLVKDLYGNLNNMGEVEKLKMTRTKTDNPETRQIMHVIYNNTIRGIIKDANEEEIKREDVVSLLKEGGQYVLIYFK